nr:immunoglobulin heavy chain junction region [Mus musculus]
CVREKGAYFDYW